MRAWRVVAAFYDAAADGYVRPGGEVPAHLLAIPAELARLEAAGCIVPLPAGDTPALAAPAALAGVAKARPVRGRKAR